MGNKRLIKKTGLYFIGNMSSKILSVCLVPLYAFYIKADDFGYYDFTLTIMNIVIPLVFVAIWESILRFLLYEDNENKRNKIIASSSSFVIGMSFFMAVVTVIYNNLVSTKINFIYYIIVMIISNALSQIWQYYARALSANKVYVFSGVIGTFINFMFNIILICVFKMGLSALFISYIMSSLSIVFIIEMKIHIINKIKLKYIDLSVLMTMLKFSAPLVLNFLSIWLIAGFGRMIITSYLGKQSNGLYAFANKFAIIVNTLGIVINMAIIEEAIILAKTKGIDKEFASTIQNLFKIFQSIIILAQPALVIFYSMIQATEYYESKVYFPWLLIYAVVMTMASNVGSIFQVIDKTKYQFITTVIGAVITVVLSYSLINFLGIMAIVIAQCLGAIAMLILRYIMVNKFIEFKLNWKPISSMLLFYILSTLICENTNVIVSYIMFIFNFILLVYINKDYIYLMFNKIKQRK